MMEKNDTVKTEVFEKINAMFFLLLLMYHPKLAFHKIDYVLFKLKVETRTKMCI